jgi:hypothetical protein
VVIFYGFDDVEHDGFLQLALVVGFDELSRMSILEVSVGDVSYTNPSKG